MSYAELVRLYFERSSALQWYWTLYVVIVGGLLAFSSLRVRRDFVTGILVTILFSFFAYKNLGAIHDVTVQRLAVIEAISQYSPTGPDASDIKYVRDKLDSTLVAPAYEGVRNFHVASDILTIMAIWAMELRRIRSARNDSAK